jgi:nitrilase
MFVVGVNPVLHADQIPAGFHRGLLVSAEYREANRDWLEPGNTAIVGPNGDLIAGPLREREETLIADLELGEVLSARRHLDPVEALPPSRRVLPLRRHVVTTNCR